MRTKARDLVQRCPTLPSTHVSKQNGSSVCGGLEPFPFASVNDQGWAPKISPLPQFVSSSWRTPQPLWSRNAGSTARNLGGVAPVTQLPAEAAKAQPAAYLT